MARHTLDARVVAPAVDVDCTDYRLYVSADLLCDLTRFRSANRCFICSDCEVISALTTEDAFSCYSTRVLAI